MRNMQRVVVWSIAAVIAVTVLIVLVCAGQKRSPVDKASTTSEHARFDVPAVVSRESVTHDDLSITGELQIGVGTADIPDAPLIEDVIVIPGGRG